jgi:hypothetical protein
MNHHSAEICPCHQGGNLKILVEAQPVGQGPGHLSCCLANKYGELEPPERAVKNLAGADRTNLFRLRLYL